MIVINRKEELQKVFSELDKSAKQIVFPMIDDVVFLEKQLAELKKYPFISINPANKAQQKQQRQENSTKNSCSNTITVSRYCYPL